MANHRVNPSECALVKPATLDDLNRKGVILMTGCCMKCKKAVEMKDAKQVKMKNGRPAVKGTCSICGTKMFKIGVMG